MRHNSTIVINVELELFQCQSVADMWPPPPPNDLLSFNAANVGNFNSIARIVSQFSRSPRFCLRGSAQKRSPPATDRRPFKAKSDQVSSPSGAMNAIAVEKMYEEQISMNEPTLQFHLNKRLCVCSCFIPTAICDPLDQTESR